MNSTIIDKIHPTKVTIDLSSEGSVDFMERLVRKKDFQALMRVQRKTIDGWFVKGLPHYSPSVNVCYIDLEQAILWFERQKSGVLRARGQRLKEVLLADKVLVG